MSDLGRSIIRRPVGIVVTAQADCPMCSGSGMKLKHEYVSTFGYMKVEICLCSCIRMERKLPQANQYTVKS